MTTALIKSRLGSRVIMVVNSLLVVLVILIEWRNYARERMLFNQTGQHLGLSTFLEHNVTALFVRGVVIAVLLLGLLLEMRGYNCSWIVNTGAPLVGLFIVILQVGLHWNAEQSGEAEQLLFITAVPLGLVALLYAFIYYLRHRASTQR